MCLQRCDVRNHVELCVGPRHWHSPIYVKDRKKHSVLASRSFKDPFQRHWKRNEQASFVPLSGFQQSQFFWVGATSCAPTSGFLHGQLQQVPLSGWESGRNALPLQTTAYMHLYQPREAGEDYGFLLNATFKRILHPKGTWHISDKNGNQFPSNQWSSEALLTLDGRVTTLVRKESVWGKFSFV